LFLATQHAHKLAAAEAKSPHRIFMEKGRLCICIWWWVLAELNVAGGAAVREHGGCLFDVRNFLVIGIILMY
jgi:hypothetical protein